MVAVDEISDELKHTIEYRNTHTDDDLPILALELRLQRCSARRPRRGPQRDTRARRDRGAPAAPRAKPISQSVNNVGFASTADAAELQNIAL